MSDLGLPVPVLMLVEPGAPGGIALHALALPVPRHVTLIAGPEGGWSPEEISAISGGASLITLGGRTLRADAMALVALSAIFTKYAEF